MSEQEHTTLVSELEWARIWVLQASGFDQPWWNKERAKHELDAAMVKIEQVQTALNKAFAAVPPGQDEEDAGDVGLIEPTIMLRIV